MPLDANAPRRGSGEVPSIAVELVNLCEPPGVQ
jgi:hypothetical protein